MVWLKFLNLLHNELKILKYITHNAIKGIEREGILAFFKKSIRYAFLRYLGFILLPYAILKVKTLKTRELNKIIQFAFNGLCGLITPMQIRDEILELLNTLSHIKPKVVLEIGTANGGTLFLFSRVASDDAIIISIDLPGGKFGGGYPLWRIPLYKSFALRKQKIFLIRADSHHQSTLDTVKRILNGRKVDFLFIDGDHTYEGVKQDFKMYSPLVRRGGIIAFHDIIPDYEENGVSKFWQEIKKRYRNYIEIVKDWNQKGYGIGLIIK